MRRQFPLSIAAGLATATIALNVCVQPYNVPSRIPFKSTFDRKASERPPMAIALVNGERVQLLVGTMPSGTDA